MSTAKPFVIDADSHVEEDENVWQHLDEEFAMRRPTIVERPVGPGEPPLDRVWLIDGHTFPNFHGRAPSVMGTPVTSSFAKSKAFSIESQSLTPPDARLADIDKAGIDVQVLFPTIFLIPITPDAAFEAALMHSYNTWIAATCGQFPERLKWVAAIPVRSPATAAAEIRRTKALGAVGAQIHGTGGDELLHDPQFDPIWAEAEALDQPIAVHVGWTMPYLYSRMDSVYASVTLAAAPMMMGLFSFIGGGILDRFPKLRVGLFEAGAEWLTYMVPRMERYYHIQTQRGWSGLPKGRPSDYLKAGNIYFACEGDELSLPQVVEILGEDHLMTSVDMPHDEALDDSINNIQARADLSESLKAKILGENAARFYGL
jgi:predicted TIM-barrel fold metal-dependent hydrolase